MNTVREVFILREHEISAHYNDNVTAIQTSPTKINVYLDNDDSLSVLTSDIQAKICMEEEKIHISSFLFNLFIPSCHYDE